MLVLLLIEENSIANLILKELREADVAAFRCRDPLRVVDCIAELVPDIIVVRQKDFPLHAQMLAAVVRFYKPLERCKFILLGEGEASFPACSWVNERLLSKQPSDICPMLLGTTGASSHRGSRLVARAQHMMKD